MPEVGDLADLETLERLASGFTSTEGPIWHPSGQYLLFSDMPDDVRRRWHREHGATVTMSPANKCNGLTLTRDLSLLVCEHSTSSLVAEHPSGKREVLASHWGDRELNSPNDVVTGADGSIYFSDPAYGRMPVDGIERDQELDFQGVYRISPAGELQLLADDFGQPNGLCFSPGYDKLYVNDTPRCHIRVFDVAADGTLLGGKVFHDGIGTGLVGPTGVPEGGVVDGMKCDELGNVYCTGPDGIWVIEPGGSRVGVIAVPEIVSNLNWGDPDWKTLYLAATTSLYRIRMRVAGHPEPYMQAHLRQPGWSTIQPIMADVALMFRFAGAGDVPAIVALVDSAYRGEASLAGWTSEAYLLGGQRTDADAVAAVLGTRGSAMLLAEADGDLAGCCQLERRPGAEVYFGMFSVRPGSQGQGWGGEILAEAERLARDEWGAATMVMTVLAQRQDLIGWYERRGYRRTGQTMPFPYGDERAGIPKRPDLRFEVLAKTLAPGRA